MLTGQVAVAKGTHAGDDRFAHEREVHGPGHAAAAGPLNPQSGVHDVSTVAQSHT